MKLWNVDAWYVLVITAAVVGPSNTAMAVVDSVNLSQRPGNGVTTELHTSSETNVLVAEVDIVSTNDRRPLSSELIDSVYGAVSTVPGRTTTRSQIQEDINSVFGTGLFSNVRAEPEDTPLGVKVTFVVEPNPVLTQVEVTNRQVLTDKTIDEIFGTQYGSILNLRDFQSSILELTDWYQDNGYTLAQVVTAPQIGEDGTATITVAEGEIEAIEVRFMDAVWGDTTDQDGNPITGETQSFIVTREFDTQPGDVFQQNAIEEDLGRAFDLGIFEDIRLGLEPGDEDPRKIKMIVYVAERETGSVGATIGFDLRGNLFGQLSYENENFGGSGRSLSAEARLQPSQIAISTNVTSVGAPMRVTSAESLAARALLAAEDNEERIEIQLRILERLQQAQQLEKVALSLSNLGQLYLLENQSFSAIEAFNEASLIFQSLDSPGLELLMQVSLARAYRQIGNPEGALRYYNRALALVSVIRDATSLQPILGERMLATLQTEWSIERVEQDERLISTLPMLESTLLLDLVNTYSAMGDYQQALYAVNAPQMATSFDGFNQVMLGYIDKAINDLIREEISGDAEADAGVGEAIDPLDLPPLIAQLLTSESLASLLEEIAFSLERAPDLMRSLSLQFVYHDLEEPTLSEFYKAQAQSVLSSQSPFLTSFIKGIPQLLAEIPELIEGWLEDPNSWINTSETVSDLFSDTQLVRSLSELSQEALTLFAEYFAQARDSAVVDVSDFEQQMTPLIDEIVEISLDAMQTYLSEEDLSRELPENIDLDELGLFLKTSATAAVKYAIASENADDAFYDELIEINQKAFDLWPSDYSVFRDLEWARDFLFQNAQGYAYWQQERYQEAITAYAPPIAVLERFSEMFTRANVVQFLRSLPLEGAESFDISPETFDFMRPFILDYVQRLQITLYLRTGAIHLALDNFDQAKSAYRQALSLDEQNRNQQSGLLSKAELSEVYYLVARIESEQGDLESAQATIATAISYHEDYFPVESLSGGTGFTQARLRYGYELPRFGHLSGEIQVSSSNPWLEEASDNSDMATLSEINPFRQTAEALTTDVRTPCATSFSYFVCKQKYFAHYIEILVQRHEQQPTVGFDAQAFEVSEQARVRSPQLFQNFDPSEVRSPEEQRLFQRRSQLNELAALSEINRSALDDDTILLEYFLGEEKSYLWMLAKDKKVEIYELPPRAVIEAQSREFLTLLTEPSGWVRPKTTARVGEMLSNTLLGPVAAQLDQKRLVIVGDGVLQYLPFAALPDPSLTAVSAETTTAGGFSAHMVPLIVAHEVVTLPSASALVAMRDDRQFRSTPSQALAIFANPVFNHEDERAGQVRLSEAVQVFSPERLSEVDVLYGALPSTQEELSQIEDLFSSQQKQTFSGFDASLKNVLETDLGDFRIVHFATHGIFNSNSPERSGIILSGLDQSGEVQPGLLSPSVAFNTLNLLDTELVVLSGCRTGLGQNATIREGLTGFTGGLLAAGTDRVVTSLWSVRDDATQELMGRFYGYMLDETSPMPAAEALRAAQISMWEDSQWQTPYYWAAFVLQGEWQ